MLSIIVTHYQEPTEVIQPLFDSIAIQQGVNLDEIEILVIQDGKTAVLDGSWFDRYNLPIRFIECPKQGVSACRNRGLDEAVEDYVMFCDCDDMFGNVFGLHLLFSGAQDYPDIINSKFVEENKVIAPYKLIGHDNDMTFIHGKMFKRDYLVAKNIRFHEDLTKHEDSPFVFLAFQLTENVKYINTPFYVWRWNPNSVMRSYGVGKALLHTYVDLMRTKDVLITDMQNRGKDVKKFVAKCLLDTYYDFNRDEFNRPENSAYLNDALRATKRFYTKYRAIYYQNSATELAECMMIARNVAYNNGMLAERMTLPQFLGMIAKL